MKRYIALCGQIEEAPDGNLVEINEYEELRAQVEAVATYAYAQGYGRGHEDTVEACFGNAYEIAADWFTDAVADGAIDALRGEGE